MYDIVVLTEHRYADPKTVDSYIENILLEDRLVVEALEKEGLRVVRKSWDDSSFDWSSARYALFRTTWDYFDRYQEFTDWFAKTAKLTQFINSETLIQWNINKQYMLELQSDGIHIPKTLFIKAGEELDLLQALRKAKDTLGINSDEFVLKPCVAGGAWHTYKFHYSDWQKHNAIFTELIAKEAMMLQEFQKDIVATGEVSMMVFGGSFTHAVLKVAKLGDFRVQDDYGGAVHTYRPSQEEIDFALNVVQAMPEPPVYARIDIFKDNEGAIALAELEVFEPELWFRLNPEAATLLARNIKNQFF